MLKAAFAVCLLVCSAAQAQQMPPVRWWSAPAESFFEARLLKHIQDNPQSADKARAAAAAGAKKVDAYRAKVKADIDALDAQRENLRKNGYQGTRAAWNEWFERNRELYRPIEEIVEEFRTAIGESPSQPQPRTRPRSQPADPAGDERKALRDKQRQLEETLANLGPAGQDALRQFREFRELQAKLAERTGGAVPPLRGPLGAQLAEMEPAARTRLGLDVGVAVVVDVARGSRADRIGLRPQDIIVKLNGRPAAGPDTIELQLNDELAAVEIRRAGKPLTLTEKD